MPRYKAFSGQPASFKLATLVQFEAQLVLKLFGFSPHKMFILAGAESVFKNLLGVIRKKRPITEGLKDQLLKLFPAGPFKERFRLALSGDRSTMAYLDRTTDWEVLALSLRQGREDRLPRWVRFAEELARASAPGAALLESGKFAQLAAWFDDTVPFSNFSWPAARDYVRQARSGREVLCLRGVMAMEALVALAAAANSESKGPAFIELLPDEEGVPGQKFYAWFMAQTGSTPPELLRDDRLSHIGITQSFFDRWKSGEHQDPARETLEQIFEALFPGRDPALARDRYCVTRLLTLAGYIEQTVRDDLERLHPQGIPGAAFPWPQLSHGHRTFNAFCRERYLAWFEFQRSRVEGQGDVLPWPSSPGQPTT